MIEDIVDQAQPEPRHHEHNPSATDFRVDLLVDYAMLDDWEGVGELVGEMSALERDRVLMLMTERVVRARNQLRYELAQGRRHRHRITRRLAQLRADWPAFKQGIRMIGQ